MPSGSLIHISVRLQGSAAGSRMTGAWSAAGRACSARTFRTWIQIITERPAGALGRFRFGRSLTLRYGRHDALRSLAAASVRDPP